MASEASWYRSISTRQWKALAAAQLGWTLDAMDVMLYAFALTAIQREFGLTSAGAGMMASMTLATSAAGGALAGWLSDRHGRARVLMYSILVYSVFTGLTATAQTVAVLGLWRALVGFGLGAEWSAGSVLVAETWPAEHRGKAIGLMQSGWAIGYLLAALLAALILPNYGWRPLFLIGTAPALFALWVRRNVREPEIWLRRQKTDASNRSALRLMLERAILRRMALASALCTSLLFAYWGLFTWLPAYLSSPVERGGAGLGIIRSSVWIVPVQIGAFFGYTLFGVLADRFGRRPVLAAFVFVAAALVPVYGMGGLGQTGLLWLGPLLGFVGHGYFSAFGALFAELFPSAIRGTAQGICYNSGRAVGALAPLAVGAIADTHGIGSALAMTSAFFVLGGILVFSLPETKGKELV